jgi:hypothetical protein
MFSEPPDEGNVAFIGLTFRYTCDIEFDLFVFAITKIAPITIAIIIQIMQPLPLSPPLLLFPVELEVPVSYVFLGTLSLVTVPSSLIVYPMF